MSSSAGKSEERSMSDILASIRKIMAQDTAPAGAPTAGPPPAGGSRAEPRLPTLEMRPREPGSVPSPESKADAKPAAGPSLASPAASPTASPPAAAGSGAAPAFSRPPAAPSGAGVPAEEPVSLDEFLAMAAPLQSSPQPAAAERAAVPLVRTPPPPAVASPSTTPRLTSEPSGPLASAKAADRVEAIEPKFGSSVAAGASAGPLVVTPPAAAAPAPRNDTGPLAKEGAPARPVAEASPAPRPSSAAPSVGDLGSVVPGRLDGTPRLPADSLATGSDSSPAAAAPRGMMGPVAPSPTPAPARTGPAPISEIPGADALRRLIADVVPPSAHGPLPTPPRSPDDVAADSVAPSAPSLKAIDVDRPKPTEPVKAPAASEPAKAPAPVAAAAPVKKVEVPATSAPVAAPKVDAPKAEAAPAALVPAPAPAGPAAAAPGASRTMDETVVELLRPLLRDWLDKNMPRLIEPALKAEMEALRSKLDEKSKS